MKDWYLPISVLLCKNFGYFSDSKTQLRVLYVLLDISLTVKAAPHEYVFRTSQP